MCSVCLEGSTKREMERQRHSLSLSLSLIYPLSHTFVFRILPHSCQTLTSIRCTTVLFSLLYVSPYSFTSVPFCPKESSSHTLHHRTCSNVKHLIQISLMFPQFPSWSTAFCILRYGIWFFAPSDLKFLFYCSHLNQCALRCFLVLLPFSSHLQSLPYSFLTIPHIPPISDTSNTLFLFGTSPALSEEESP